MDNKELYITKGIIFIIENIKSICLWSLWMISIIFFLNNEYYLKHPVIDFISLVAFPAILIYILIPQIRVQIYRCEPLRHTLIRIKWWLHKVTCLKTWERAAMYLDIIFPIMFFVAVTDCFRPYTNKVIDNEILLIVLFYNILAILLIANIIPNIIRYLMKRTGIIMFLSSLCFVPCFVGLYLSPVNTNVINDLEIISKFLFEVTIYVLYIGNILLGIHSYPCKFIDFNIVRQNILKYLNNRITNRLKTSKRTETEYEQ